MSRRAHPIATRLLAGALWGLIVTAAEVSILPVQTLSWSDQVSVAASVGLPYILSGMAYALIFGPLAPRMPLRILVPITAASFFGLSIIQVILMVVCTYMGVGPARMFGRMPDTLGIFLHGFWQQTFFGGLALAAYLLRRRADRTRAFIARAMIAARRSETALAQASARVLRGQVQPERLAEFITAVRVRYQRDLAHGDLLLERLTDYLRAAMPTIRSGEVSPAAEREIAKCLRRLSEALKSPPAKVPQHEDC
jgi:hypothetical protein